MPKYKIKKYGEEIRVIKGKHESEMNLDILEQCEDDEKALSDDEALQEETDENPGKIIDPRTYEEIMFDAFQAYVSKSSQVRCTALDVLCEQMQSTYNPKFLMKHNEKLVNIIENSLESNIPSEMESAAKLLSLTALQLPQSNKSLQFFSKIVCAALKNPNLNCPTLCHAIGILTFLYEVSSSKICSVMDELVAIINAKSISNESLRNARYEFRTAALETWMFLTILLPSDGSFSIRSSSFGDISHLLESGLFSMRAACAKAIAVTLECGRELDKLYVKRNSRTIIEKVSYIANTRNKNGRDIKTAMEVLQYLEKGVTPHREIRIGKSTLELNTWALNVQYDMLSNVIGSANVTKHLSRNTKLLTKMELANSAKNLPSSACTKDAPLASEDSTCSTNEAYVCVLAPVQQKQYNFDKLSENFANATHESAIVRTKALDDICKELQLNYVPNSFLETQMDVVLDIIIRTMKRGNEAAEISAIRLATLMILQLGYNERFCGKLSKSFSNSIRLVATTPSVISSMCMALAFFELVDLEHNNKNIQTMDLLRNIFSGSQSHSKTFSGVTTNEESNLLCCKAVEAWGLLLTLCSPKDICTREGSRVIKELTEMIHTPNIELRVACGQVICLIIEQGRIYDKNYHQSDVVEALNAIKNIVSDRCRNISKDKIRTQNTKFRDILKYLEDDSPVSFQLRFAEEIHELKTWSTLFKYQKLCEYIGPGLTTHFVQNDRLRDILGIGPKPVIAIFDYSQSVQHKFVSAAKKKSQTKENRLNLRRPKFECI